MWPNPQFPADLVTYTEEILNEKLRFLCSVIYIIKNVREISSLTSLMLSKRVGWDFSELKKKE